MFKWLRKDWERLKSGDPGHRFQDRYHRLQERKKGKVGAGWLFVIIFGLLIIGLGIIFLFIPGSGWALIILGLGLMSGENIILAKILDIGELIIRKLIGRRGNT